ncbi:hypothetical protein JW898_05480, partial [Candidatus Woesearchaeota archaeon]|nr:hypothetical protein [Candidatus Woesearchaeota archaeon]
MKKNKGPNRVLLGLAVALAITLSIVGMISLTEFIGWYYHAAQAGTITAMTIRQVYIADAWHGFAGTAVLDYSNNRTDWNATVTGGETTIMDLDFNCFGKSGYDLYISTVPLSQLNLTGVQPATVAEIDAFIGINPSDRISSTSTFNETFTVNLGGTTVSGPGVRTKSVGGTTNTFHQAALKDGNGALFFTANATRAIPGYDGEIRNYQVMVPVPYNQTNMTYYFFPDPVTDILGACMEWSYAPLKGYVNDTSTGLPMANVTIEVGDAIATTNASGWYYMLAPVGISFIMGYYPEYFDYVNFTTINYNETNWHNFSMVPTYNQTDPTQYGFVSGQVFEGNTTLENVMVYAGVYNDMTDATGNYSVISPSGDNVLLVSIKDGYRSNVSYVNITPFETIYYDIQMVKLPGLLGPNGTIYGKVRNGVNNESLENATVYIGSWSGTTNETGDYYMNIPTYEFYYIIAIKELYDPYVGNLSGNLSLDPGEFMEYDIYLNESPLLTAVLAGDTGKYEQPPGTEGISNETPVLTQPGTENGTGLVIRDVEGKIAAYLSIRQIKTHIKQDSFVEHTIAFYNFQDKEMTIDLSTEGDIDPIFELSERHLSIMPNSYGEVEITIMGNRPPGVYTGNLLVRGGIDTDLPVEIRISKEGKIPIKTLMLKLDVLKKIIVQGEPVKYKLDLINLFTDRKYKVDLKFFVASINGTRMTEVTNKSITLETFTSLVGQIPIPADFPPADYVIRAQADYLGLTSTADALFTVREPFYEYDLLGIIPIWLLATLLALVATSVFAGQEIKRRQDAKKRFHAKVEYDELPFEGERSLFVGNIA